MRASKNPSSLCYTIKFTNKVSVIVIAPNGSTLCNFSIFMTVSIFVVIGIIAPFQIISTIISRVFINMVYDCTLKVSGNKRLCNKPVNKSLVS